MDPATISIITSMLPMILGLFGGQKERDPREVFNQLNALLGTQFQPLMAAAMQLAGAEGARVGQDIAGSVGRAGGGATGAGAVSRSVGAGLASSMAADAKLGITQAQLGMLAQLFPQFMNPGMKPPGPLQNLAAAYGNTMLSGYDPLQQIFGLFNRTPTEPAMTISKPGYGSYFTLPKGQTAGMR